MVCANKSDLPRQVDEVEARLWAELRGYPYFETSALSGQGINDMFHAFFSLAVKAQEGRSRAATPTSARRVQLTKSQSGTSMTMPRKHAAGSAAGVESRYLMTNSAARWCNTYALCASYAFAVLVMKMQTYVVQKDIGRIQIY